MSNELPVHIGNDALVRLTGYLHEQGIRRTLLVADRNTYAALGERAERAVEDSGVEVRTIILNGKDVLPNEHQIVQVLLHAEAEEWVYLAVGSGTITDIVRFASHRTRTSFISLPTAPSVDGFAGIGAPLLFGKWKQTVNCQPPRAIFADEATLRAAPRPMIAAGFGDMLGKYTSVADWTLGGLVGGEPYNEQVARKMRGALETCVAAAGAIGRAEGAGMCALIDGLIESGLAMTAAGTSSPAGGSEHHLSHFWEMKLLQEDRPPIFHGAKVGVATPLIARRYARLRAMTRDEAAHRLATNGLPNPAREEANIRRGLGALAEASLVEQTRWVHMTAEQYRQLASDIVNHWDDIQRIAATVPPPERLTALLGEVGAPVDTQSVGLNDEEVALAQEYGHYLRNRFTMLKLAYLLGI